MNSTFKDIREYLICSECHEAYHISELIELKDEKKICTGCLFENQGVNNEKQK